MTKDAQINYDEWGHKCIDCGKWLCETPEKLECFNCKGKREREGICGEPILPMGLMLSITKCKNCRELIYREYTPEDRSFNEPKEKEE